MTTFFFFSFLDSLLWPADEVFENRRPKHGGCDSFKKHKNHLLPRLGIVYYYARRFSFVVGRLLYDNIAHDNIVNDY